MRSFVIVVDMQRDFVMADGALPVGGAEALIEPVRAWLAERTPEDIAGMLFTFDTHVPEVYAGSPESESFPLHCVRDTPGWALVADWTEVDPAIPVWRLEKGVFAMWEEPGLVLRDARGGKEEVDRDAFFRDLKASGVDHVIVIGVAADYCVKWAIDGLVERRFSVEVPAALTRGIEREMAQVVAEEFARTGVELV